MNMRSGVFASKVTRILCEKQEYDNDYDCFLTDEKGGKAGAPTEVREITVGQTATAADTNSSWSAIAYVKHSLLDITIGFTRPMTCGIKPNHLICAENPTTTTFK